MRDSVLGFWSILGILFIIFKVTESVSWSWWVVLLPFYGGYALVVLILIILIIINVFLGRR